MTLGAGTSGLQYSELSVSVAAVSPTAPKKKNSIDVKGSL